mmetsp:Transcript_49051/g.129602  ORF Transcript_49051/g.129602 Transcript_49051/m.129602 type:complete len:251 (+) Transcript_49051:62-814(+)
MRILSTAGPARQQLGEELLRGLTEAARAVCADDVKHGRLDTVAVGQYQEACRSRLNERQAAADEAIALIERGADVLITDHGMKVDIGRHEHRIAGDGYTPLHRACQLGSVDAVVAIVAAAVTVQIFPTGDDLLPWHGVYVQYKWPQDEGVLRHHKNKYELHFAGEACIVKGEGGDEVAAVQPKQKRLLDDATRDGFTPLHLAAMWGRVQVVRVLLQLGADGGAKTTMGYTPYDLAHKRRHDAVCRALRGR